MEYPEIPPEFLNPKNEWRKVAEYIIDNGNADDVRLVPKQGTRVDVVWQQFLAIANDQVISDCLKKGWAAWILSHWFERCFYEYD